MLVFKVPVVVNGFTPLGERTEVQLLEKGGKMFGGSLNVTVPKATAAQYKVGDTLQLSIGEKPRFAPGVRGTPTHNTAGEPAQDPKFRKATEAEYLKLTEAGEHIASLEEKVAKLEEDLRLERQAAKVLADAALPKAASTGPAPARDQGPPVSQRETFVTAKTAEFVPGRDAIAIDKTATDANAEPPAGA